MRHDDERRRRTLGRRAGRALLVWGVHGLRGDVADGVQDVRGGEDAERNKADGGEMLAEAG